MQDPEDGFHRQPHDSIADVSRLGVRFAQSDMSDFGVARTGENQKLTIAARDIKRLAGDPRRFVRRKEHGGRGDVVRLANSAERRRGFDLLARITLGYARWSASPRSQPSRD